MEKVAPQKVLMRERSSAVSITTKTKDRLSTQFEIGTSFQDEKKKFAFTNHIMSKLGSESQENIEDCEVLEFTVPTHSGKEKSSVIKFAENSRLVDLEKKYEVIPSSNPTVVDFKNLINQFEENKIDAFEIQDLMNFDFEAVVAQKEKLNDLIDKMSVLVNTSVDDNQARSQLLSFLSMKLNDLKNNERQVKVVINNIESVKELSFIENKIVVKFE